MIRVHQFNKVEQFVFTRPEDSWDEHERLLANTERIVAELGLPYRVVVLPAGDMSRRRRRRTTSRSGSRPGSLPRDGVDLQHDRFQARRLGTRYRGAHGLEPVHTLNGTAVVDRMALAILENFQGDVPDVLVPSGAHGRSGNNPTRRGARAAESGGLENR